MPSTLGIVASGAGVFSPLDLSPFIWLDGSDTSTITASGGAVSQWSDKSGNGKNVSEGTASLQPKTGTTTLNGLNVISFDGTDRLAAATASDWNFLVDGTQHLFAAVLRSSTSSVNQIAFSTQTSATTAGWRWGHLSTNVYQHFVRNATTTVVANEVSTSGTSAYVVTLLSDAGNATAADRSAFAINGGSLVKNNTATAAPPASAAQLYLGQRAATLPWTGYIAEVVIVSGAKATETNRQTLRDYLNSKWAVY